MTKNDDLEKYIQSRMEQTQAQFDTTKATFLTAGLIVAISFSMEELSSVTILGYSAIKLVLASTIFSAIFLVLSYVFAEHQVKRHDKMFGGKSLTKIEKMFLGNNIHKQVQFLPWFYGSFHNKLISLANNLSTTLLLVALGLFAYVVIGQF